MEGMKSVFFTTSNPEKAIEAGRILGEYGIAMVSKDMDIPEDKAKSQLEIAKDKARHAMKAVGAPSIAEDTGVYFDACEAEQFPGINSRDAYIKLGFKGLLKKLEGKNRGAYFKAIIAFCEPGEGKETMVFEGICRGTITDAPVGQVIQRMPYDNIFVPEGEPNGRTFSQMTKDEKAKYSHRAKAVRAFADWYAKR